MTHSLQSLEEAISFDALLSHGLRIAVILITAFVIWRFGAAPIRRIVRRAIAAGKEAGDLGAEKRAETLARIFTKTVRVVVAVMALLMILPELGIKVGPLLAGVGIAGVAFGFGAQYLVRDVISGLFLLLENQYRVGDVVSLDGTSGLVEEMNLRMTTLRDLDGTVHHILHGNVKNVANMSKRFSRVNLNVGVSYDANLAEVERVVNAVGQQLAADPAWRDAITKPPQFLRVDDFGDSAVVVKILGETRPLKQWDVAGELRRRLKRAFDEAGIEIPYPQRVVHHRGRLEEAVSTG